MSEEDLRFREGLPKRRSDTSRVSSIDISNPNPRLASIRNIRIISQIVAKTLVGNIDFILT